MTINNKPTPNVAEKTQYLSRVHYDAKAGEHQFAVTFQYNDLETVRVLRDAVELEYLTDYFYPSTHIVQLNKPLKTDARITIRRETPLEERAVDFVNAAELTEADLDASANQVFFAMQEAYDNSLDSLKPEDDGSMSLSGKRLTNVGDPYYEKDAANKRYVDKWFNEAIKDNAAVKAHATQEANRSARSAAEAASSAANSHSYAGASKTYSETSKNYSELCRDIHAEVEAEGQQQLGMIQSLSDEQKALILKEGSTQTSRVSTEGNAQFNRVNQEGGRQHTIISSEGTKQYNRVKTEGDKQVQLATEQANLALSHKEGAASEHQGATQQAANAAASAQEASTYLGTVQSNTDKTEELATSAAGYRDRCVLAETNAKASEVKAAEHAGTAQDNAQASDAAIAQTQANAEAAREAADRAEVAAATLTGALVELGNADLSTGVYPEPYTDLNGQVRSCFWKVIKGGTVSGIEYGVGDTLVYSETLEDYYKIDNTESVTSVNGHKGAVTLTKSDVGLSNVPNYAFTAEVNDASTVKFAAAGAVKQAYDLAASKITKAQGDSYYLGKTANAVSASKWATSRTLTLTGDAAGSVSMDGSANVSLAVTVNNAATGDKWTTARTLTLTGDVTGSVSMDGSKNVSMTATVANDSHTHVLDNISDILKHVPAKVKDLNATDLNTLNSTVHAGFYRQTANASASLARNYPVASAGSLLVMSSAGGVVQMYIIYNTGAVYTRGLYNNAWSSWRYSYDSGNKPTKADVGLSAVNNWGATSSVSDSSTSKYATAAGVKTAYDKAVAALNAANNAASVAGHAGETAMSSDGSNVPAGSVNVGHVSWRVRKWTAAMFDPFSLLTYESVSAGYVVNRTGYYAIEVFEAVLGTSVYVRFTVNGTEVLKRGSKAQGSNNATLHPRLAWVGKLNQGDKINFMSQSSGLVEGATLSVRYIKP
ncbi:long tail fiber distal subunit [Vibrio alginolyticus]|uniref:Long tail fiber distal subunit n=1 Tax=Vibrio alginolyticus TaxID=663 RepID=A0A1W6UCH8_VIBAL|nr:phage tail fiber protein [Vibrio alginolyticus]ARP00801.1 long tail fiber distal subunit [Vibrio alginolyticus]ARP05501.1 long tail fiber distal subunit [Vibrio alginolyticus]ARP10559.1 long tail fiber distal subunit [Vibrio alginolyticus]ARP15658.1 long tail fiber distal subunit [Vibrio alginolyticus]ARP20712.1 long tail fiber distal subunit [Vibrio alginolyticus]